jgi:hypothetical protein
MILFTTLSEIARSNEDVTAGNCGGVAEEVPGDRPNKGTGACAESVICDDGDAGE